MPVVLAKRYPEIQAWKNIKLLKMRKDKDVEMVFTPGIGKWKRSKLDSRILSKRTRAKDGQLSGQLVRHQKVELRTGRTRALYCCNLW